MFASCLEILFFFGVTAHISSHGMVEADFAPAADSRGHDPRILPQVPLRRFDVFLYSQTRTFQGDCL
jgi:hypothetical protein